MLVVTAQVVTFLLALAGYFFDFVQKDEQGNNMRTSFGLPLLTRYGVFAVVLAVASNGLAYWKTTTDAASAERQNKELSDKYDALQRQYKDLQKQNDSLSGKVDDKFQAQLQAQEDEAKGILKDLHAGTAQTIQQLSTAAARLRYRTLNAFESDRRAQSPVKTVSIFWDWPHGAKAWDSLSSLCRSHKPGAEVHSISIPANRPATCNYESESGPYLELPPADSQSMANKIGGVRIYSPPFSGNLDFRNRANTSIFVDDEV